MPNWWFTSDSHLGHANILKYDVARHIFKDLQEHDETIIENWNRVVSPNDMVYHLGDFSFAKDYMQYLRRLNGQIHLIFGNHDKPSMRSDFISGQDVLFLKKEKVFLSHYPHYSWINSHHGVLHLFGHVHEAFKQVPGVQFPNLNVGTHFHNFTPISLEEARERAVIQQ